MQLFGNEVSTKALIIGGAATYMGVVWWLRKKRAEYLATVTNPWRMARTTSGVELYYENITAMELNALLRVYAIPSISWLLLSTGGFNRDCLRRYQE